MPPESYVTRLRTELAGIASDMDALLDRSTIRNVDPNTSDSGIFVVGAAKWGWAPSDAETSSLQMRLLARYRSWLERFRLLFPHPTPDLSARIDKADRFVQRWIERDGKWDHSIPSTIDRAKEAAAEQMATFGGLIDLVTETGDGTLRVVPDTNAFIRNADLASYARSLGTADFVVHLLPTVLSELDDLKDRGAPEVRNQAQGVIRRMKGLRDKGSLAQGVKLTRTIMVKTEAREVDVRGVLDWLDPNVSDDRIIAAALRLQSAYAADTLLLVTSDLNLQNKADAVGLPYVETPPSRSSLRAALSASIRRTGMPGQPPLITLVNNGPAVAQAIDYSVATAPESGPHTFRAGPWHVERLASGQSDEREVWGMFPPVVTVTVSWTDDEGANDLSWTIDFPPPGD